MVRPSSKELQVIIGPQADQVAGEMRDALRARTDLGGASQLLAALGGPTNIAESKAVSSRLCFTVHSDSDVIDSALAAVGLRGIVRPAANRVHAVIGPEAAGTLAAIRDLIAAARGGGATQS